MRCAVAPVRREGRRMDLGPTLGASRASGQVRTAACAETQTALNSPGPPFARAVYASVFGRKAVYAGPDAATVASSPAARVAPSPVAEQVLVHQASSECGDRQWTSSPAACSNRCVRTGDRAKADVVFAHPARTVLNRSHGRQVWAADFWESPARRPPCDLDHEFSLSYHKRATFPKLNVVTDTSQDNRDLPVESLASKRRLPMVYLWISNCGAGARSNLLGELRAAGITTASHGRCERDSSVGGDVRTSLDHARNGGVNPLTWSGWVRLGGAT
jgi:hypothetical protein